MYKQMQKTRPKPRKIIFQASFSWAELGHGTVPIAWAGWSWMEHWKCTLQGNLEARHFQKSFPSLASLTLHLTGLNCYRGSRFSLKQGWDICHCKAASNRQARVTQRNEIKQRCQSSPAECFSPRAQFSNMKMFMLPARGLQMALSTEITLEEYFTWHHPTTLSQFNYW